MKFLNEYLNLQSLKNSPKRKHQKIHEKAHRLINEGHENPILTDSQIMEIADKYDSLNVKIMINGNMTIKSKNDIWLIIDEGRFYTLYHKANVLTTRKRIKEKYHVQDVFYDIEYIFASIVSHDEYAMGIKRRRAKQILEIIEEKKTS